MVITARSKITWHYKTLPVPTKRALDALSKQAWFGDGGWYLAGGTALALQTGNRKSYDLDFFTTKGDFDIKKLLEHFAGNEDWKVEVEEKNTLYGELHGAKVSFIAYPFFVPDQPFLMHGTIKVLDKTDVAVMKIVSVSQRGRKRDFFDLYWCAHHIEPLESIIRRLKKQYPSVAHDYHHILKSIMFFEDAESDPDPQIFFDADWNQVKRFFKKEIPQITRRLVLGEKD